MLKSVVGVVLNPDSQICDKSDNRCFLIQVGSRFLNVILNCGGSHAGMD